MRNIPGQKPICYLLEIATENAKNESDFCYKTVTKVTEW